MKNFSEVVETILSIKGFKNEAELIKHLGISSPAFYNHKRRGSIPIDHLLIFCERENLSLDVILFGRASTLPDPAVDKITAWLRAHPDDAEMFLKIIEGREAMERLKKG